MSYLLDIKPPQLVFAGAQTPPGKKRCSEIKVTEHVPMTSPSCPVGYRPCTPENQKHRFYNMSADKAEQLLQMAGRKDSDQWAPRQKMVSVIKRKLINKMLVPTRANAKFHLYLEIELVPSLAAKSIFFGLKRFPL